MSNSRHTRFLPYALFAVILAACGSDTPATGDGTAGTSATGVMCGTIFCKLGETCNAGVCVAAMSTTCTLDSDCNGGSCCNQMCIASQTDRLNCGGCGMPCTATQNCVAGVCTAAVCTSAAQTTTTGEDGGTAPAPAPTPGANGCPANETCAAGSGSAGSCMCGTGPTCTGGTACSATGVCGCGSSGLACTAGQACCGAGCVDTQTSASDCGACGNACASGQACVGGVCGCATSGQISCGGTCTDTQTDAAHCGKCDTACPTGATCTAGACACAAGEIDCKGKCVDGTADTRCGACDVACTGETTCAEKTAGGGEYLCLCPNVFDIACGDVCVDPTQSDNCGGCGNACSAGVTSCATDPNDVTKNVCLCDTAGDTYCAGPDACFDLQTNHDNCGECGLACLGGESCVDGACTCPGANQIYCDENSSGVKDGVYACISNNGKKNCFGCGVSCTGSTICDGTTKGCLCVDAAVKPDPAKDYCNNACINTTADALNCGGCGVVCPAGPPASTCTAGKCSCPVNQLWCSLDDGFACASVKTDVNNCNACGMKCAVGNDCCGGACKDPATAYDADDANCGACGNSCATAGKCGFFMTAKTCKAGVCSC